MLYLAEKSAHTYFVLETFDRQKTCLIYFKLESELDSVSFIIDIRYSNINIFYMMKLLREF